MKRRRPKLPKFKGKWAFRNDFYNHKVLVYREDGTRTNPDDSMQLIISKLKCDRKIVYAILDGPFTFDYLFYQLIEDKDVPDDRFFPKFEFEDGLILGSQACVLNKKHDIKDYGSIRVAPVIISHTIESLRRLSNDEYWAIMNERYMDHIQQHGQ